jgi:hypothetical protein
MDAAALAISISLADAGSTWICAVAACNEVLILGIGCVVATGCVGAAACMLLRAVLLGAILADAWVSGDPAALSRIKTTAKITKLTSSKAASANTHHG